MRPLLRTLFFTGFTFIEYVRSGRILVEILASSAFFYIFFLREQEEARINADHFFTLTGLFTLVITFYTTSSVLGLGTRPQGYIILARKLGRSGYLMGLYLCAVAIVTAIYIVLGVAARLFNNPSELDMGGWLFGSLPLVLNIGLLTAFLLIISPLVFSTGWRLFFLSLVALAFSNNFIERSVFEQIPSTLRLILQGLQTIFSWPLVPAFAGFALSINRTPGIQAAAVLTSQCSLLIALLGMALYAFSRREIIFFGGG